MYREAFCSPESKTEPKEMLLHTQQKSGTRFEIPRSAKAELCLCGLYRAGRQIQRAPEKMVPLFKKNPEAFIMEAHGILCFV